MSTTHTAPKCPFDLPITSSSYETTGGLLYSLFDDEGKHLCEGLLGDEADFIAHAINSHATLTAEVARLREALERQKVIHAKIALAATHDGLKEFAKAAMAEVENITAALRGGA